MAYLTPAYADRAPQLLSLRQRALAWGAIAAAHAGLFAWMLFAPDHTPPQPAEQTFTVTFISMSPKRAAPSEPAAAQPAPPIPDPAKLPPRPETPLASTSKPTPSLVSAPPTPADVKPQSAPQSAPAAPTTSIQAAPSAAPAVASNASAEAEGPITPPNFSAAYLNNAGAQYPYASRRKHEEGLVKLKVMVSVAGKAEQVTVVKSSGSQALDQAALEAVKRWRFVPAKQGGKAIAGWVTVPVEFSLKDS